MLFKKQLPLSLLLLFIAEASEGGVPHTFHAVQRSAVRRVHRLAQDLRVAFGGVISRSVVGAPDAKRVVYCKPGRKGTKSVNGVGKSTSSTAAAAPTEIVGGIGNGGNSTTADGTRTRSASASASSGALASSAPSDWKVLQSYQGNDFFTEWEFFTGADPTGGTVTYLDASTAQTSGFATVNSQGNFVMSVDTTNNVSGGRKSVRISTQQTFTGGLLVVDSVHMPTGCGTWPAFWTDGPNWPNGGEIDIIEGVHQYTDNQATIHTTSGCSLPSADAVTLGITGAVIGGTDCDVNTTGNQGCGIRATTSNSFGTGFNANGGGVYAMKWDTTGIAVYFFPRGSTPDDITAGAPQPDSWSTPQAHWPASSCNPFEFFNDHQAIFDTTFCGQWAGNVWTTTGIPGQAQSCAQITGVPTCEAYVLQNGSAFADAYWEVMSVVLYQHS